ncbi:hypothetical protein AVEN_183815-1 [Araneus ventricosus]|uniref:Uncharacterized protein n=1 Tax=Araneus ventricosus TaxID=182803 RepID=A0A4Y2V8M4_ARAVE|nr:hypothetical protein AVEN_183815-1 [Araneus ventricosus]
MGIVLPMSWMDIIILSSSFEEELNRSSGGPAESGRPNVVPGGQRPTSFPPPPSPDQRNQLVDVLTSRQDVRKDNTPRTDCDEEECVTL